MAFRLSPKTISLDFGDVDLNAMGVEVFGDVSMETLFNLQIDLSSGEPLQMKEACLLFGESVLKSWDVQDDDGVDIPATGRGFLSLPMSLATAVMTAWTNAVGTVDPNLKTSPNGSLQSVGEQTEAVTK